MDENELKAKIDSMPDEIEACYSGFELTMYNYHNASERAIAARSDLERKRLALLVEGKIIGKNEDERKASARTLLSEEYRAVDDADMAERYAKYSLEISQVRVDEVRLTVRALEMASGPSRRGGY